ncbi:MAG: flagellar biosynthesis protein [Defluviitaleaceae bacterium]|nr:flagellar biosynthesis protein [Defluviitaleaceae bacterium]
MDGLTGNLNVRETRIKTVDIPIQNDRHFAGDFRKVLDDALHKQESVHFSKHANMRLIDRQITLTGEQMNRVEAGLSRANAKGIRDSLVLVDDIALVVNVKSKTVITALGQGQENVFSNIDGAVIV